jgi:hypothetical protein
LTKAKIEHEHYKKLVSIFTNNHVNVLENRKTFEMSPYLAHYQANSALQLALKSHPHFPIKSNYEGASTY